jgi:hypothetical protein
VTKDAEDVLKSNLSTNQALATFGIILVVLPLGLYALLGMKWVLAVILVVGICVSLYAITRLVAVRFDLSRGPITERCYVQSFLTARSELLFVKTTHGSLTLGNATSYSGAQLAKRWILLVYAPRCRLALQATLLDE